MNESTIRGYRIVGESKPDKQLSMDYLKLTPEGSHALQNLWREAPTEANCIGREEEFQGDILPSDRDAQLLCSGCPKFAKCDIVAETTHPAWGVWAGKVYGRKLAEAMDKED